jgi:multidrug efflux pump subunit AcrB
MSSEVLAAAMPEIEKLEASLPIGYTLEIGGEHEEQVKGFKNLAIVMLISIASSIWRSSSSSSTR